MPSVEEHYGSVDLLDAIDRALRDEGLDPARLTAAELSPIDHFHTGGKAASVQLAELAGISAEAAVLDVGGGLGGPARFLAETYGCTVTSLDLTPEYCRVAAILNERTGLSERVHVVEGDALDLPFPDASFDLVWTQHAVMNIADKARFYAEARRVLRTGGRIALYDITAGENAPAHTPVPWADEPELSILTSAADVRTLLGEAGFRELVWEDATDEARALYAGVVALLDSGSAPAFSLQVIVPRFEEKFRNLLRNVNEGRIRHLRAVCAAA